MDNNQKNIKNKIKIAYIPAGAAGSKLIKNQTKAFLNIAGRPAIIRCLDAINKTTIETVVTWNENAERMKKVISSYRKDFNNIKNILILKAKKNLGENVVFATTKGLLKHSHHPKYTGKWNDFKNISKYRLNNPSVNEEPVLIVPVDAVLLSNNCLEPYIKLFNNSPDYDVIIGYTKKNIIENIFKIADKDISKVDSTIKFYDYVDNSAARHNNIFIIKPMKLMDKAIIDFMKHYHKNRFQSKLKPRLNMYLRGSAAAFKYKFRHQPQEKESSLKTIFQKILYPLDILDMALFYNKFNKAKSRKLPKAIIRKARKEITTQNIERVIKKIFDLKTRIYLDGGIEVMDIDDDISYDVINENYSKLIKYGNSLTKNLKG